MKRILYNSILLTLIYLIITSTGYCAESPVKIDIQTAKFARGLVQPLVVKITNPANKPLTGILKFTLPKGWKISPVNAPIEIEPKTEITPKYFLFINPGTKPGKYVISVKSTGDFFEKQSKQVEIFNPFTISARNHKIPSAKSTKGEINAKISNLSNVSVRGLLKVILPKGWKLPGGNLMIVDNFAANSTQEFDIAYIARKYKPGRKYTVIIDFTSNKVNIRTFVKISGSR